MAFEYRLRGEKSRFRPDQKEPYTISRSKIELFTECPRCYWLDARFGIGRPDSFPFTLNNAVDTLFKKEFDIHRAKGEPHPLMTEYGIDAVPFDDPRMDEWRDALRRGVRAEYKPLNLIVRGGIDDVWINTKGELHVADYKATAGKDEVTMEDEWKDGYKRQAEVYQWLFRQNGFKVSPIAYFVYANGNNDKKAFDGKLEFDVTILPYEGDDSWIPATLEKLVACIRSDEIPKEGTACKYCPYRKYAGEKLQEVARANKKK
jgi:hypothetical protein